MVERSRRAGAPSPLTLAGWLFAELAMVLVVVAFGSQPGRSPVAEAGPGTGEHTAGGLSLKTENIQVTVTGDSAATVDEVRAGLRELGVRPGQVGLVLLFGVSRDGNALNGTAVSEQLRGYLLAATVPEFASGLDIRPYIGGRSDGEPGDVKVELFLFSGSR